jgi:excisionase family DNA binding protein
LSSEAIDEVLTLDDAAVYLKIKPTVLARMTRDGSIGSLKIGRVTVFPRAVLEDYVRVHTTPATTNPWGLTPGALRNVERGRRKL